MQKACGGKSDCMLETERVTEAAEAQAAACTKMSLLLIPQLSSHYLLIHTRTHTHTQSLISLLHKIARVHYIYL